MSFRCAGRLRQSQAKYFPIYSSWAKTGLLLSVLLHIHTTDVAVWIQKKRKVIILTSSNIFQRWIKGKHSQCEKNTSPGMILLHWSCQITCLKHKLCHARSAPSAEASSVWGLSSRREEFDPGTLIWTWAHRVFTDLRCSCRTNHTDIKWWLEVCHGCTLMRDKLVSLKDAVEKDNMPLG